MPKKIFFPAQEPTATRSLVFSFGKGYPPILDASLLLIEPQAAAAYRENLRSAEESAGNTVRDRDNTDANAPIPEGVSTRTEDPAQGQYQYDSGRTNQSARKRFYANIDLDPIKAKKQFIDLVDEVIEQFTLHPGVQVKIAVEIQAESADPFDETLQRAVNENCTVLKFKNAEFEE